MPKESPEPILIFSSVVRPHVRPQEFHGEAQDGSRSSVPAIPLQGFPSPAGRGGAGGEDDAEADEADDKDPSAYWREVPPGVYSLQLKASLVGGPGGGLLHELHPEALEEPSNNPWGATFKTHPWSDPTIRRISEYSRAESGVGLGTGGSTSAHTTSSLDMDISADGKLSSEIGADQAAPESASLPDQDLDSDGPPEVRSHSQRPAGIQTCWDQRSAAEAVLMALQSAVDVSGGRYIDAMDRGQNQILLKLNASPFGLSSLPPYRSDAIASIRSATSNNAEKSHSIPTSTGLRS